MPSGIYQHKSTQGFQKGNKITNTGKTRFKKGHTLTQNEQGGNWKGDNVGYPGVHAWVVRKSGKPKSCEDCGKVGERTNGRWTIEWSNCDHKYKRNIEDYKGRCPKCHSRYDRLNKLKL